MFHVRAVVYFLKSNLVMVWISAGAGKETSASGSVFTVGFSKGPDDQFGLGKLPDI